MGGFFEVRAVALPLYQMLPKAARSFSKVRTGEQIITCNGKMPGQAFSLLDYNLEGTIFDTASPKSWYHDVQKCTVDHCVDALERPMS